LRRGERPRQLSRAGPGGVRQSRFPAVPHAAAADTLLQPGRLPMSVAKVTELSSTSTKSFEDAINTGLARANKTIRNIRSAWIKEQQVRLENGKIVEFQVNMMLTFVLED
jgi:flavin-binding protein dodecin